MFSSLNQLKLLTWKYFQFRKYHWLMTIVEICVPILFIYLAIVFSHYYIDTTVTKVKETDEVLMEQSYFTYKTVFYTPPGYAGGALTAFLEKQARYYFSHVISSYPIKSENELVLKMANATSSEVGIVILEYSNIFRYKIHDTHQYNTSEMFFESGSEQEEPEAMAVYRKTGFLTLMSLMNEWFVIHAGVRYPFPENARYPDLVIERDRLLRKVRIAQFPYPEYTRISPSRSLRPIIFGFIIIFSSMILCGPLISAIVLEESNGMKELLKIVGVPEIFVWFIWYLNSFIMGLFIYTVATFLLKHDFRGTDDAVIRFVNGTILWLCLILYYAAQVSFCFMFCIIFNSVLIGITSLIFTSVTVSFLAYQFHKWRNIVFVHLSCFIPAGALTQGFIRFAFHEVLEIRLSWKSLFANEINAADASIGYVFVLLIVDTFLYLFLTYYISVTDFSKSGFRKSPFFVFEKEVRHYKRDKTSKKVKRIKQLKEKYVNPFVEPRQEDAEIGLILRDLRMNFGYVQAVKRINLTVNRNEIFVLLGNNGAGKTTTLQMMAGLLKPTSGQILYRGAIDLYRNIHESRKIFGVCPQMSTLFPYMTVMDHLIFFGMLKGISENEATKEAKNYLKQVNLTTNADDLVLVASKIVKRKLSLLIALMGNTDILILDEPTTDLDVSSKRLIWNLLLKLRENHTIILTSQFMKEAEILGDRIAIMNQGLIVADGSSNFLKKTFGTGYRLKLIRKKLEGPITSAVKDVTPQIVDMITKSIPGSRLESRSLEEVVFSLPSSETAKFPGLIRGLETKKNALKIHHIVVLGTTLEQVFLKLSGNSVFTEKGTLLKNDQVLQNLPISKPLKEKVEGYNLKLLQHKTLLGKKLLFLYRNAISFILRVILPTILMLIFMREMRKFDKIDPPLELTIRAAYPGSLVMIIKDDDVTNYEFSETYIAYLENIGARIHFPRETKIVDALLKYAHKDIKSYRREMLLAHEINSEKLLPLDISLYNKWARHSEPILITALHTALLQYYLANTSYMIFPINHPIKPVKMKLEDKFFTDLSEHSPIFATWFILLAFITIDLLDYFVIPIKVERIDGFKHIQLLSSVSLLTYWINNIVFDSVLFFTIVVLRIFLFRMFDYYGFFNFGYHMMIVILVLILFILSGLLFIYVISFAASSKFGSYIIFFIFNIMCMIVSFTYYKYVTAVFSVSSISPVSYVILTVIKYSILLIPPLNFSLTVEKLLMTWRVNHMVEALAQHGLDEKEFGVDSYSYSPYLIYASAENPNGILEELEFMVIDIWLYASLLYIIEQRVVTKFFNYWIYSGNLSKSANDVSSVPKEVLEERKKVDILTRSIKVDSNAKNVLLVYGMKKVYKRLFHRSVNAVNDVTFAVKAGECFGVLGPSGSGKTTTFKMLTDEIVPSEGNSWILNFKLRENKAEYFSKAGYCPEINCVLEDLTGKEILNIIASLRGVSPENRDFVVYKWLSIFGLGPLENKQCGLYSSGDQRKICTALALIGDPHVVFLDEPARDIDPISRRKLYDVLIKTKSTGQAIALTSNSIEECELLCDRFTILVDGNMKFIGTVNELKKKYAHGFSLQIKLQDFPAEGKEIIRVEEINILKKRITSSFKPDTCQLIEETKISLRYKIKETLPLADSFQKMEELKRERKIIEEYLLTETSLEEVFYSLIHDT